MEAQDKPRTMDINLDEAPHIVRFFANMVRDDMTQADVRKEASNQWPREFPPVEGYKSADGTLHSPATWFPETDKRARDKLRAFVVGHLLGVTKLEAPPKTLVVNEAARYALRTTKRQERRERQVAAFAAQKEARTARGRAKAKDARKARKRSK